LTPEHLAAVRGKTEHHPPGAVAGGRLDEQLVAPDDRRAVAGAGQGSLPEDVLVGPLGGDVLVDGDAAAVGPAEARPVAIRRGGRQEAAQEQEGGETKEGGAQHEKVSRLSSPGRSAPRGGSEHSSDYRTPRRRVKRQKCRAETSDFARPSA